MNLRDRVVIVTGGAGGLGGAVVEAFVAAGAAVAIVDRPSSHTPPAGVQLVHADITGEAGAREACREVLARHGRVDVLCNLVGGYAAGQPVAAMTTDVWHQMLTLNVDTCFHMCRAALPSMIEQGRGRIVNVGSRAATQPTPNGAAYAVAKRAVVSLTETLAEEVRQQGVTVNAILPSIIDTPANRRAMPDADHARWPKPEELARVILFLASDDAAIVSGAAIPVYGRS